MKLTFVILLAIAIALIPSTIPWWLQAINAALVAALLGPVLYVVIEGALATALRSLVLRLDRLSVRLLARHGVGVRTISEERSRHWQTHLRGL